MSIVFEIMSVKDIDYSYLTSIGSVMEHSEAFQSILNRVYDKF